jgi:hypothetical protein
VYRWCPFCWSSGQGRIFYPDVHEIPALGADSSAKGLVGPGRRSPSQPEVYILAGRHQGNTINHDLHLRWRYSNTLNHCAIGPRLFSPLYWPAVTQRVFCRLSFLQHAQFVRAARRRCQLLLHSCQRGLCLTQSVVPPSS